MDRDLRNPENAELRRLIMAGNLMAELLERYAGEMNVPGGPMRELPAAWESALNAMRERNVASRMPKLAFDVEPICVYCGEAKTNWCEPCRANHLTEDGLGDEADVSHVLESHHA